MTLLQAQLDAARRSGTIDTAMSVETVRSISRLPHTDAGLATPTNRPTPSQVSMQYQYRQERS